MPLGTWRKHLSVPVLLCLSVALGSLLPFLGHLAWSVWPYGHVSTFDTAFLHREPLQVGDMRAILSSASHAAMHQDWAVAVRLVRDGRNQWEVFQTQIPSIYGDDFWSTSGLRRCSLLWDNAVSQAELSSVSRTLRTLERLQSALSRYRFRSARGALLSLI
ncbi:MAG: hypothetical protein ACOX4G_15760 [Limnochordia bacterium]